MFHRLILLSISLIFILAAIPQVATAQTTNCDVVETLGNGLKASILEKLNSEAAGKTKKINRRKALRINAIRNITFEGCRATLEVDLTLKRKVRRNASGPALLTADVTSIRDRQICLKNMKVRSVKLSHTLPIGESFYRWIANICMPSNPCFGR